MRPTIWIILLGLGFFATGCVGGGGQMSQPLLGPGPSLVARGAVSGELASELVRRRDGDQGIGVRANRETPDFYEVRTYENEWTIDGELHRTTRVQTRAIKRVRRNRRGY